LARKGYRFRVEATVLTQGALFEEILASYENGAAPVQDARSRIRSIVLVQINRVLVQINRALPLDSPAYQRQLPCQVGDILLPIPVPGRERLPASGQHRRRPRRQNQHRHRGGRQRPTAHRGQRPRSLRRPAPCCCQPGLTASPPFSDDPICRACLPAGLLTGRAARAGHT
jgi:hypothetical protein